MALRGVKRKLFDHPSRDPNLDWSEYSEENFVDEIYLNTLHITAVVGKDAWNRDSKPQPVEISVRLQKDVSSAGEKDDIDQTVSYGKMCKDIQKLVASQKEFDGLEDLNDQIKGLSINNDWGGGALYVTSVAPKATLRAEGGISLQSFYAWDEGDVNTATWWINDMKMACIIGVNPHERLEKQLVIVNLGIWEDLFRDAATAIEHGGRNYWRGLTKDVVQTVEASSYETLEALATETARMCGRRWPVKRIAVSVQKPSALSFVDCAGVSITRTFDLNGQFHSRK